MILQGVGVKHPYYQSILLIERLHRHFLEVVKAELDREGTQDINNIQALILYNIGQDELTVGELTARGYYLGSNVSYNVKKMVDNGYLEQQRSQHDRRSIRLRVTAKGLTLCERIGDMLQRHISALNQIDMTEDKLQHINESLVRMERFWSSNVSFQIGGQLD